MVDLSKSLTTLLCAPTFTLTAQDARTGQVLPLHSLRCTTEPLEGSSGRRVVRSGNGMFFHPHTSPDASLLAQRVLLTVCTATGPIEAAVGWVIVTKEDVTPDGQKVACAFRWEGVQ